MHFCTYFHDFARDPERKIGLYFRGIYQCRSWVGTIPYVTTDLGVSYVRIVPIQSSTTGRCLLGGETFDVNNPINKSNYSLIIVVVVLEIIRRLRKEWPRCR